MSRVAGVPAAVHPPLPTYTTPQKVGFCLSGAGVAAIIALSILMQIGIMRVKLAGRFGIMAGPATAAAVGVALTIFYRHTPQNANAPVMPQVPLAVHQPAVRPIVAPSGLRKPVLGNQGVLPASAAPHPAGASPSVSASSSVAAPLPARFSLLVEDLRTRLPRQMSAIEMLNLLGLLFKDPVFTALNPAAQANLLNTHLIVMARSEEKQLGRELAGLGSISDTNRDVRSALREWLLPVLNPWNGHPALVEGLMEAALSAPDNPHNVRLVQQLFSLPIDILFHMHFFSVVQANWKTMPETLRQAARISMAERDKRDPFCRHFEDAINLGLQSFCLAT